ncbi:WD_REPEATS_REGION domain-containing protein [Lobosporangium transversale]|nr:WD_REPEATS_REGION domain-containing protein [Lobosporangium transversale]
MPQKKSSILNSNISGHAERRVAEEGIDTHTHLRTGIETSLRQFRCRRLVKRPEDCDFYIQLQGRVIPQVREDEEPLMEIAKKFLSSNKKVMLVQGYPGTGKSMFCRTLERYLWDKYEENHRRVPLFISLPAINNPQVDLVVKHLQEEAFTEAQIRELKKSHSFILICDGYDESMRANNLYMTNRLNQSGEWRAQMVISCNSDSLGPNYQDCFQPTRHNLRKSQSLFLDVVIAPLCEMHVHEACEQYMEAMGTAWDAEDYSRAFRLIPDYDELKRNPFLLSMSLQVLPQMMGPGQSSTPEIKRISIYDQFIQLWYEKKLKDVLELEDKRTLELLSDGKFAQKGIKYIVSLATAIYRHQGNNAVVEYSPLQHKETWKEAFFGRDNGDQLLLKASPLAHIGNQYRFIHHSLLEYCLVRAIFEPQDARNVGILKDHDDDVYKGYALTGASDAPSLLIWRGIVNEPSVAQFLAERALLEPIFKEQLLAYVEHSKSNSKWRIAAANAMTILVRAGVSFSGADLRGIQIPGADVRHGNFDSAQLQGADLRKVKMRSCWLREADLSGARMKGVQFGEWMYNLLNSHMIDGAYSPCGKTLAVCTTNILCVYDTSTWDQLWTYGGDFYTFNPYSPDGRYLAFVSARTEIHICEAKSGKHTLSLIGHENEIRFLVYSPDGYQIASVGQDYTTVRVWSTFSGSLLYALENNGMPMAYLEYSPDGHQLASSAPDNVTQLWDLETGQLQLVLESHKSHTGRTVYSLDGREIYSHTDDNTICMWDTKSGQLKRTIELEICCKGVKFSPDRRLIALWYKYDVDVRGTQANNLICILSGHIGLIEEVAFQPNGHQLATCAADMTIRLWNIRTGEVNNILYGHMRPINCIRFSPSGHQLATCSDDYTLRVWDARQPPFFHAIPGHECVINCVVSSPDGTRIASGSNDCTIRLWDAQTGVTLQTLNTHMAEVTNVRYSPTGHLLASRDRANILCLWDTTSGQLTHTLRRNKVDDASTISDINDDTDSTGSDAQSIDGDFNDMDSRASDSDDLNDSVVGMDEESDGMDEESDGMDDDIDEVGSDINETEDSTDGTDDSIDDMYDDNMDSYIGVKDRNISDIAFSPTGHQIASGHKNGDVCIWDTQTGQLIRTLKGGTGFASNVAFSPDGQQIASLSGKHKIMVWSTETVGEPLHTIAFKGYIRNLIYLANGHQIVTLCDLDGCGLYLIDTKVGKARQVIKSRESIRTLVASPCGRRVVCGYNNRTLAIVDMEAEVDGEGNASATIGRVIHRLEGLPNCPCFLKYSPDGRFFASGTRYSVYVWDAESGKRVAVITNDCLRDSIINDLAWVGSSAISDAEAEETGLLLAAAGGDGSVRMWQVFQEKDRHNKVDDDDDDDDDEDQEGNHRYQLKWSSKQVVLNARGTYIEGVIGLCDANRTLLEQRGAVGTPSL